MLLYLAGAVSEVFGFWQIGSTHSIESEDSISAVLRYASGATGVIQASTSIWPGYAERLEVSGTKGTAIVTGGSLTTWDVLDDAGEDAPITSTGCSGASDPMAISVLPLSGSSSTLPWLAIRARSPAVPMTMATGHCSLSHASMSLAGRDPQSSFECWQRSDCVAAGNA